MKPELLMLKGLVSEMPEDQQKAVANAKEAIKQLIEQHGEPGFIALCLLSLELAD